MGGAVAYHYSTVRILAFLVRAFFLVGFAFLLTLAVFFFGFFWVFFCPFFFNLMFLFCGVLCGLVCCCFIFVCI